MGNPVIHFEIVGSDGPGLEKFYGDLFGWHVQSFPEMSYGIVDTHAGDGINGGIGTSQDGTQFVTVYVETPDPQASLDKAVALGGRIVMEVTEIPNVVTLAQFADPAGNIVGLVGSTDEESPGVSAGSNPPVSWFEIMGPDGKALGEFYTQLFGWSVNFGDGSYGHVDTGAGRGISGGIGTHPQGGSATTVYATVGNLTEVLKKAENAGGKTFVEPMKIGEGRTIALFADPQGNVFGLVTGR